MKGAEPRTHPREPAETGGTPEELFLRHLPLIERAASYAARRAGFPPQEVEDFVSTVKVKLIDDDYAILRKHRGDSSLPTFLTVTIKNHFKDHCNHRFGKYRPSAKAKELGPTAIALERLLVVDKHDLDTAIEILRGRHQLETPRGELRQLAASLPTRLPRRFTAEDELDNRPSSSPDARADRRVEDGERSATATRVEEVLNLALATLSHQDLLILKMHFRDGCTIATIAAALHLEQKPLYKRKAKCLDKLRAALHGQGLHWDEVRQILGWQGREIRADFGAEPGKGSTGPSNSSEEEGP